MGVKLDILGNDLATSSEDISHQVNNPNMGSDGFRMGRIGQRLGHQQRGHLTSGKQS